METTTRQNNNRSLTLAGVNKLFSCLEPAPVVKQDPKLGFYSVAYRGEVLMDKTLTNVSQSLLKLVANQETGDKQE